MLRARFWATIGVAPHQLVVFDLRERRTAILIGGGSVGCRRLVPVALSNPCHAGHPGRRGGHVCAGAVTLCCWTGT